ncbi:MAG: EcsC family protein [Ruminococcus sp.]|nr:EcsC family protein [Ruminococcus sp.]
MRNFTAHQKEWHRNCTEEEKFLNKINSGKKMHINRILDEKIPKKLRGSIDTAFLKAFSLIFEKGTDIIEKTYNKKQLERDFRILLHADRCFQDEKALKNITRPAERSGNINIFVSGASGIGMGLFGAGLPDIPVFTGMILKCIYEISLRYGFRYNSNAEKYLILLIIEGAVSDGEQLAVIDNRIEEFIRRPEIPIGCSVEQQTISTSHALTSALMYTKVIQGIPIVGAVGGAYDFKYMKRISKYANIKYKKRFLLRTGK